jgi:hypothetical protein
VPQHTLERRTGLEPLDPERFLVNERSGKLPIAEREHTYLATYLVQRCGLLANARVQVARVEHEHGHAGADVAKPFTDRACTL